MNRLAYTVSQAAEVLQLSERTVRELIATGKLIARQCGNERGIRIGHAAIERFLTEPDPELVATNCSHPTPPKRTLERPSAPATRRKTR